MTLPIAENVKQSFEYAKGTLFGKWVDWLILIVLTIIPVVNFIGIGRYLKIFRGEDPSMDDIGKCFMDGLMVFIIAFVYMIIPAIILIIPIIGWIIGFILMIAVALLLIPAIYGFANNGSLGGAFAFKNHLETIKGIGWGEYIIAVIVFMLILFVLSIVNIIPVLGTILWIIALPFALIMAFKYLANVLA